ncbi:MULTISPECIES: type II toxin-antitoxin system VapC family toxin [Moraxella]|uniref:type II toxin-antitoxin system VapC family toxin n=1 Tax=Moraxella TaxID=475 RepID=UPI0018808CCA|nr:MULTISPECIES: type II toxin-antitoxin system VapC family toxin [Moraxella]MBE9577632.1 type II toxin-antitoxin system VapC family toxin [Moraxella sp. K1664]MBE9587110.1 type II toxin-antitoxin system VapC family toxin [Moraxella sp. K1630]MBE9590431.1 type II toxin-antitoxin system VapC family toxin [Moraxella sp. K127]MBE9595348.1 type II toxin-antitoxin system VapC family toxin [Moraxella sp. K2450]MDH9217681.1 type II toxin-antitoxin system VapC family toxin [Moraxella lacunata]
MNYLLDTHIVIWLAKEPHKLSNKVKNILENTENIIYFSTVNLWEIALKTNLKKDGFKFDTVKLYQRLLENGFLELGIDHKYTKILENLPIIHKDPFDRMLIAQSMIDDLCLITNDDKIIQYQGLKFLTND